MYGVCVYKDADHASVCCCVGTGLQETYCVEKMRQLTLVSLAMEAQEIPFSRLSQELHMEQDQLEQFVINGETLACVCVCVWGGGGGRETPVMM